MARYTVQTQQNGDFVAGCVAVVYRLHLFAVEGGGVLFCTVANATK